MQNECLAAENHPLKAHLAGFAASDSGRATLAEIGKRLGRKRLARQVARPRQTDAIPGWRRKLVAKKFDGSKQPRLPGRPRISRIENLVSRIGTQKLRLENDHLDRITFAGIYGRSGRHGLLHGRGAGLARSGGSSMFDCSFKWDSPAGVQGPR
jgi:hypothetical protein